MVKYPSRQTASYILTQFDITQQQLKKIQHETYKKLKLAGETRARTTVLVNDVVRLKGRLDDIIETMSGKKMNRLQPDLRSLLRIGCYELLFDDHVPEYAAIHSSVDLTKELINKKAAGLTNAVLRKILRQLESDPQWLANLSMKPEWQSFPKWMIKKWEKQFGEKVTIKLCQTYNQPVPMFLRLNQGRMKLKSAIKNLAVEGIVAEKYESLPDFLRVTKGQSKVLYTPLFTSGIVSVQDPASAAIIHLLEPKPGETVLDVCAAPGTKSLMIAEMVTSKGTVLASDRDKTRVDAGIRDMERHQLRNIRWSVLDALENNFPSSKKILVDAPCTGTGVIGRRPDIKWRRKVSDGAEMAELQLSLLINVSRYLMSGGTLVYATCSLEPEENWGVVEQFLKYNRQFKLIPPNSNIPKGWINEEGCLMTFPAYHGTDGMFAAKLSKT